MEKVCAVTIVVATLAASVEAFVPKFKSRPITYTNEFTTMFENNIGVAMLSQSRSTMVTMPLTVRLALCRLAQVARGQALEEIINAFSFNRKYSTCSQEVKKITSLLRSFTIVLLNKIYVNDTNDLNPSILNKSATAQYGVHVEKMNFRRPKTALAYINKWFELNSLRRLSNVLSKEDLNYNTSIVVLSAAHIKTTWEQPFNIFNTRTVKFRNPNNTMKEVQMMSVRGSYLYYHDEKNHFQIVSLPLISYGMVMTFMLPDGLGNFGPVMRRFISSPGMFQVARHNMRYTVVKVSLPRFRIKSTFKWDEALQLFGVRQLFNTSRSGMHDILKSRHEVLNMYLSLVKQKVFFDMDEMGAIRTTMPKDRKDEFEAHYPFMSHNILIKEFVADQPFLFSIDMEVSHSGDQAQFAVGVYYGPDE